MTRLAVCTKRPFVYIGVAISALAELYALELLVRRIRPCGLAGGDNHLVALNAFNLLVLSGKFEGRKIVIEALSRLPGVARMTCSAICSELRAVFVEMTIGASRVKPEKSLL